MAGTSRSQHQLFHFAQQLVCNGVFLNSLVSLILTRFRVTLISSLSRQETEALGFYYTDNLSNYLQALEGSGYIIPSAENILPLLGTAPYR